MKWKWFVFSAATSITERLNQIPHTINKDFRNFWLNILWCCCNYSYILCTLTWNMQEWSLLVFFCIEICNICFLLNSAAGKYISPIMWYTYTLYMCTIRNFHGLVLISDRMELIISRNQTIIICIKDLSESGINFQN